MKRTDNRLARNLVGALAVIALATIGFVTARAATPTRPTIEPRDILAALRDTGHSKVMVELIQKAGLTETFKGKGPLTLFAPTDDSFASFTKSELEALKNDEAKLKSTIKFHAIQGRLSDKDFMKEGSMKTLEGGELRFKKDGRTGAFKVNDATIGMQHPASNGIIFSIDKVLMPETADAAPVKPKPDLLPEPQPLS